VHDDSKPWKTGTRERAYPAFSRCLIAYIDTSRRTNNTKINDSGRFDIPLPYGFIAALAIKMNCVAAAAAHENIYALQNR
jgi:hypothetical protein